MQTFDSESSGFKDSIASVTSPCVQGKVESNVRELSDNWSHDRGHSDLYGHCKTSDSDSESRCTELFPYQFITEQQYG